MDELKIADRRVFVALPQYGAVDCGHVGSLLGLTQWMFTGECPFSLNVAVNCGDSLVCRSRNTLSAQFLQTDCTHLLFIDSDILFTPAQVERLCSHPDAVVGGLYCHKADGPGRPVLNTLSELPPKRADGLQEVAYAGTGFLCIARQVFELMIQHGSCQSYAPDNRPDKVEFDFWSVGVTKGRYLSEDWAFCERWRELGGTVWVDTKVLVRHAGRATFPLQSQEVQLLRKTNGSQPRMPEPVEVRFA